jgi:dipeptidyl aminopeptidase/acylaminoacyl peptidase
VDPGASGDTPLARAPRVAPTERFLVRPFPSRSAPRLAVLLAGLLLPAAPLPLAAQDAIPGPSFEEVISLRGVGAPAISPDGRSVAFTVRTTDWQENRYESQIWLAREGEEPFPLTRAAGGTAGVPQWSPDGRWIAFLADRGDRQQVHLIRAHGGEAQKLTEVEEGVSAFRWSPDGARIALLASDPESEAMRERRERFGEFAVVEAEYRQSHLWILDVRPDAWPTPAEAPCPTGERQTADGARPAADRATTRCAAPPRPTRLTRGDDFTVSSFAWSPDGTRIAFERRSDPRINSGPSADLSVLTVASGEIRPLVVGPGYDGSPVWSPDSRWILYSSTAGDTTSNFYTNGMLFRIPAEGGTPTRLAADFDEWVSGVAWTPTGIYFLGFNGTRRHLHAIDPASGRVRVVATTPDNIQAADFSADGRTVAFLGQSPTTLGEIYRTPLARFQPVTLTAMSRQIADWGLGTSEVVAWTSTDGERIEGVLHRPRDFDPSRRYPLFVVIHGGPTGIDVPTPVTGYVYPVMQWLAKGALVLRPNYRGSAGYGERFRSLNVRNLGVGDAWDVVSGRGPPVGLGIVDTRGSRRWGGARAATSPPSSPPPRTASARSPWAPGSRTG